MAAAAELRTPYAMCDGGASAAPCLCLPGPMPGLFVLRDNSNGCSGPRSGPRAATVAMGSGLTGHGARAGCLILGRGFDIPADNPADELARVPASWSAGGRRGGAISALLPIRIRYESAPISRRPPAQAGGPRAGPPGRRAILALFDHYLKMRCAF